LLSTHFTTTSDVDATVGDVEGVCVRGGRRVGKSVSAKVGVSEGAVLGSIVVGSAVRMIGCDDGTSEG